MLFVVCCLLLAVYYLLFDVKGVDVGCCTSNWVFQFEGIGLNVSFVFVDYLSFFVLHFFVYILFSFILSFILFYFIFFVHLFSPVKLRS